MPPWGFWPGPPKGGAFPGGRTGCNARGWSRDHKRQGRRGWRRQPLVREYAGGYDIVARAMQAVAFEWLKRGPATALTQVFLEHTGAAGLDDLVEAFTCSASRSNRPWC